MESKVDWAILIRELVGMHYSGKRKIAQVMDNLNTKIYPHNLRCIEINEAHRIAEQNKQTV